jgi:CDP-6-deoxy-D-xylo-4-hexulose-3-dehydrase
MLIVKGCYKDGKIELQEPIPANITEAELQVIVLPNPSEQNKTKEQLKAEACSIAREYYQAVHNPLLAKEFIPGVTNIPYGGRVFDEQELVNLISSSLDFWLTAGPYAEKFEKGFAEKLGVRYCSLVNSGSSANLLAVMALTSPKLGDRQLRKGDEVITVAAGFPTTINPVIQAGAVPVFVDVTLPSYNIDVSMLEAARSDRTKAVMLAHALGNPFDLDKVTAFCKEYNLWLIEDNCDSLGSLYKGRLTGTFGDIGTSSFYPPHHITMGEGGAVYTNSSSLNMIVESLRDWGRDCRCPPGKDNTCGKRFDLQLGTLPKGYDHKYMYSHFGYNLKATDMQAAIGCAQLEKLDSFIAARRKNWQALYDGLKDLEDVFILPESTDDSKPSWFGFMLTVRDARRFTREEIVRYLESNKIQTRMLFAGNYTRQPVFDQMRRQKNGYRIVGNLDNTDRIMNNSFWLGVYPGLTEPMLEFMVERIQSFVKY